MFSGCLVVLFISRCLVALVHCRCSKVRLSVGASSWENPLEMTGSYSGAPLLRMSMATPRSTTRALPATFKKRARPPRKFICLILLGTMAYGSLGRPWGSLGLLLGAGGALWGAFRDPWGLCGTRTNRKKLSHLSDAERCEYVLTV